MVFSQCSPFLEMMENLQKPLHPSGEVSALHPCQCPPWCAPPTSVESPPPLPGRNCRRCPPLPPPDSQVCCPSAALKVASTEEPEELTGAQEVKEPQEFAEHVARSSLPTNKRCGAGTPPRIVGGKEAELGQVSRVDTPTPSSPG